MVFGLIPHRNISIYFAGAGDRAAKGRRRMPLAAVDLQGSNMKIIVLPYLLHKQKMTNLKNILCLEPLGQ